MRRRILSVLILLAALPFLIARGLRGQAPETTFAPTRFSVTVEGAAGGPAVLLLPGLSSSRAVFDAEAKLLAGRFRLYRLQINGFAGQAAGPNASGPLLKPIVEELHRYIAANHLHPAVIGHSMGGLLGLELADAHPEDVRKLLIVDTLPFYALVFNPEPTVDSVRPQAEAMRTMLLQQTPEQQAAQTAQSAGFMVNNPDGRKRVIEASLASDRAVFVEAMYEDLLTDLRPRMPGIKTQTTLLYPYDAGVAGPDSAKVDAVYAGAYKDMPHVTVHRIDSSRHFIMYDQPKAFDAEVEAFLSSRP